VSFAPTPVQAAPLRFSPRPLPILVPSCGQARRGPPHPCHGRASCRRGAAPADPMPADPVPADTMLADLLAWRQRAEQAEHLAALAKAQALEQERLIEAYELREQVVIQDMPINWARCSSAVFVRLPGSGGCPPGCWPCGARRGGPAAPARASVPMLRPAKGLSLRARPPKPCFCPPADHPRPATRARTGPRRGRSPCEGRGPRREQALARAQAEVEAAAQAVARAAAQAAAQAEARASAQAQAEARARWPAQNPCRTGADAVARRSGGRGAGRHGRPCRRSAPVAGQVAGLPAL
jgi:hypothetical protein